MPFISGHTVAIVPIKPFAEAKSRLAEAFGPAQRSEIAERLARKVLSVLRTSELEAIVVTCDPRARILAAECGATIIDEPERSGLNAAWELGIEEAERLGMASALLLPADLPHVEPADIRTALRRPGADGVVIAPSQDSDGTNALCIPLPPPLRPAYGPGSCRRHVQAVLRAGAPLRVLRRPGLAIDADRPSDLGSPTDPGGRAQTS
ncbi:MAG: 2-phospho-L-lactate guanylyltransferase [Acidobacteria bacterium]|nr:MAG: 2-phospho-L-lactate guanylyltransferase [Acidobacteriota bacterium]